MLFSLAFTFSQFIYCKMPFNIASLIVCILISIVFFSIGFLELIKTNHPLYRLNPFKVNSNYKARMEKTIDEDPGQLLRFDRPTESQVITNSRKKKFNKI